MAPAASPGVVSTTDVLATLKRFDSDVEEVLASSGHVSLYSMAVESQQWTRKDVEGSLFLLKRRGTPRFQMMVLNKLSTENYVEDIHGGLDFELNPPYLMYTHGNSEIIGVWFYEQDDLHRVEDVLKRIKQTSQGMQSTPAARPQVASCQQVSGKGDDEGFWDKPATIAGGSHTQPQPASAQQLPALAAPAVPGDTGSSNLANLLRNAQLKQQQQQQQQAAEQVQQVAAPGSALPQPLPPSFFAQQQRVQPPQAPHPQSYAAPSTAATASGPVPPAAAPQPLQRVGQVVVPAAIAATAEQVQPAGGQMGGALAKLFANAHKAPAAQPVAAQPAPALAAPPAVAALALPAAVPPPAQVQPQVPGAGGGGGGGPSDEERVRRLLSRIATNDGLVKMLAAEMRAVGLL